MQNTNTKKIERLKIQITRASGPAPYNLSDSGLAASQHRYQLKENHFMGICLCKFLLVFEFFFRVQQSI